MSVDTTNKRYSAIHVGCPWRSSLPIPDGSVDQGDRQHVAGLYRGVLADPLTAVTADQHPLIRGVAGNRTTLRGIEGMRVALRGSEGNRTELRGDL